MSRKAGEIHFFILMETVMALGLLMVLAAAFFVSLRTLDRMDRAFTAETRALQTVGNTVERLGQLKHYDAAGIKRVFLDEFGKSGFPGTSRTGPRFVAGAEYCTLAIIKADGKTVIEVRIKCRK